jgi:hypothetical protein
MAAASQSGLRQAAAAARRTRSGQLTAPVSRPRSKLQACALVVAHGVLRLLGADAEDAGTGTGPVKLEVLLERGRIHRVTEVDFKYRRLERRIGRILIELGLAERCREGRRLEGKRPLRQADLRRNRLRTELHAVFGTDAPVFLGSKLEHAVRLPMPGAGQCRRRLDTLDDILADLRDRRHPFLERDQQRMRLAVGLVLDLGAGRFGHREGDHLGLGLRLPPLPAVERRGSANNEGSQHCRAPPRPRAQHTHTHRTADTNPTQPGRRAPLPAAEQGDQNVPEQ